MNNDLSALSIKDFISALASKQPVPGGGGACALAGSLACALASMVANFTVGKKKYLQYQPEIELILARSNDIKDKLLTLMLEDAEAFYPLSQAYGLSKDDETRDEVLQSCLKRAVMPPISMMRETAKAVELLEELAHKGSKIVLSDVGVGAMLCHSALLGASLNVFINTKLISDETFASKLNAEAVSLCEDFGARALAIFNKVKDELYNG